MIGNNYYLLSKEELADLFAFSEEKGLLAREVRRRQIKYGENKLPQAKSKGVLSIFFDQFRDFMIMVLMAATFISFLLGEIGDGITIFAIIILNGIMGFVQEYRAERSLAALKELAAPKARVVRDNKVEIISTTNLVPGDLVLLETGDKIPADCRIWSTDGVEVDESLLTGESVPVMKEDKRLYAKNLDVSNQLNMLFMGTTITRGNVKAIVVNIGIETEMGKIARLLENENKRLTPLQKRLTHLGKWLVLVSLIITFLIVIIGIVKGQSVYQMFLAGVSLAVAAIPEGLPAIVTLALALGVQKMIKNKAIVRRLQAVETLGCATVICTDKTGTLTQNQMVLSKFYIDHKINCYNSEIPQNKLDKVIKIGGICNSVLLKEIEREGPFTKVKKFFVGNKIPELIGDPTEIALVKAIYNYDLTLTKLRELYKVVKVEEFDSKRRRMSVLVETPKKKKELWIKGAPESIFKLSKYIEIDGQIKELNDELREELIKANNTMAGDALRVLALAYRPLKGRIKNKFLHTYEHDLIIVALVGLMDPPRPEAYQAVKSCFKAGIKPIMVTGDHMVTAQVIAEDLGIISKRGNVITGKDLKEMDDNVLKGIVKEVRVYARIAPEEKLRIVKALKDNGEIVAMTGDGVNDAPAVKEADIGIAMGEKGTDVTKEVSSLVLADDNFATIVAAIKEGRIIYNNIRKFIRYLLSCNIGELLTIFMGIVMGLPLPLLPIQILWVNLVTDGLPALALGMDEDSDDVMNNNPREPSESIFAHGMISNVISQGVLIGISTLVTFLLAIYQLKLDIDTARTMAFSTLVFSQLFFVFSCRSEKHCFWELPVFKNMYLVMAVVLSTFMQLAVIYLPQLNTFFHTSILNLHEWLLVIILSIWSTIVLNLVFCFYRKYFN